MKKQKKIYINKVSKDLLINKINELYDNLVHTRSCFPCPPNSCIKTNKIPVPPFYSDYFKKNNDNFHNPLIFNKIITHEYKSKLIRIGDWVNKNFIIGLYALLDYALIIFKPNIDKTIDEWKHIDILRRLRSFYVHSFGEYNPIKHKKLRDKIIKLYELDDKNPQGIPLPINEVLTKLFEKCKSYIEKRYNKENQILSILYNKYYLNISKLEKEIKALEREKSKIELKQARYNKVFTLIQNGFKNINKT